MINPGRQKMVKIEILRPIKDRSTLEDARLSLNLTQVNNLPFWVLPCAVLFI